MLEWRIDYILLDFGFETMPISYYLRHVPEVIVTLRILVLLFSCFISLQKYE